MKIVCAPSGFDFVSAEGDVDVVLYGRTNDATFGSAGAAIKEEVARQKINPDPRAWDFLSIALSVLSADLAGHRDKSSDGWTRDFDLYIAVADKTLWDSQTGILEKVLMFLTTDRWNLHFLD